jgi:putative phage-type endonuclease
MTPEQAARRRNGLGASDASSAVGLNPYYSAIELWQEKRGEVPPFMGNEATRWGKILEHPIRQEYAEQTGRVVRLPEETLQHPVHRFMFCHPDGVTDDGRMYEGKTARYGDDFGEPGTDQVPEHYLIQCQHGMLVTGLKITDLAVLIGGQDFRLYHIEANESLQASLVEAESAFWQHVVEGTRPALDYRAPTAIEILKKLYPGTNGQTKTASLECIAARTQLEQASADLKSAEARKDAAKALLLDFMGEAALLRFPDGRAYRRARVDRKGYTVEPTSFIDARWITLK